jgi:hypothetical protein
VQLATDITEGEIGSGHCGDSYAALTMGGEVVSDTISAEGFCSARCASLSQACAMAISNILFSGLVVIASAMDKHSKA